MTTRFNDETWLENVEYRNITNIQNGCIYGTPKQITNKIPTEVVMFVIEMNNTTNKVLGIGLIKNMLKINIKCNIYKDNNYNRFIYKGEYRIDRSYIEQFNPVLLEQLEQICFKGKTHLKRYIGLTRVTDKVISVNNYEKDDILNHIRELFLTNFERKCNNK